MNRSPSSTPAIWSQTARPRANRDVIRQPIDENILHTLLRSETFRAAYELRGLSDETLLDYPPLQKVSKSFIDAYNETLESLR